MKVQPRTGNNDPVCIRHVTRGASPIDIASPPPTTRFFIADDGFSIRNFAGAPRTPKKSRLVAPDTAVEKPRSPQATSESLKTSCQLDTLGDDIPTHTAEEIVCGYYCFHLGETFSRAV